MLYLILAIASSMLVSVCMRLSEGKAKNNISMLAMNYLMCMAVAGSLMGFGNIAPAIDGVGRTAALGLFNGVVDILAPFAGGVVIAYAINPIDSWVLKNIFGGKEKVVL